MNRLTTKDLTELADAGIISSEQAHRIEAYYSAKNATEASGRLRLLFGTLGSLLVSLAIILLIAHNWDELTRTIKTIIAFLPLLAGQSLCVYTIWKKRDNHLWNESASVALFFAVPASISIITQIYNIDGTTGYFLASWLLLTFPLLYVMRSTTIAFLLLILATAYACEEGYSYQPHNTPWLYALFLAALAPHYLRHRRLEHKGGNTLYIYNWLLAASVASALGAFSVKWIQ